MLNDFSYALVTAHHCSQSEYSSSNLTSARALAEHPEASELQQSEQSPLANQRGASSYANPLKLQRDRRRWDTTRLYLSIRTRARLLLCTVHIVSMLISGIDRLYMSCSWKECPSRNHHKQPSLTLQVLAIIKRLGRLRMFSEQPAIPAQGSATCTCTTYLASLCVDLRYMNDNTNTSPLSSLHLSLDHAKHHSTSI